MASFAELGWAALEGLGVGANNVGEAMRNASKRAVIDPAVAFGKGVKTLVTDPAEFGRMAQRAGGKVAAAGAAAASDFGRGAKTLVTDPAEFGRMAQRAGGKVAAAGQAAADKFLDDPSKGFTGLGAKLFVVAGSMSAGKFLKEVTAATPEGAALRQKIKDGVRDFVQDERGSVPLPGGGGAPKRLIDPKTGRPFGEPPPPAQPILGADGKPIPPTPVAGNPGLPIPQPADLSKLGGVADKAGLTKAGRSLAKHTSDKRKGSKAFPEAKGTPAQINQQAQKVLDDILNDPDKVIKQRPGRPGDQLLQVHRPDGSGVIFKWNGTSWDFSHFAENLF
jgi:hypothetical protein